MRGMSIQERYEDISRRSGVPENTVKRVLVAERESVVESLKKGEKAILAGRCIIDPRIKQKLGLNGNINTSIYVKITPSATLSKELQKYPDFIESDESDDIDDASIAIGQIESLL